MRFAEALADIAMDDQVTLVWAIFTHLYGRISSMNNQEAFEQAVAGNWIAESFNRPNVADGIGKFYQRVRAKVTARW